MSERINMSPKKVIVESERELNNSNNVENELQENENDLNINLNENNDQIQNPLIQEDPNRNLKKNLIQERYILFKFNSKLYF